MRSLEEIQKTPVLLLTDEEIEQLDPASQEWARNAQARHRREQECPGHERVETATRDEARRGWHRGECKHCGKDMSYDSGD